MKSTVNVEKLCGPSWSVSWVFLCSIIREKWSNNFFHWKGCLSFSEVRVFNNLVGPKRRCYSFYSKGQNSRWTLGKCSLRFVTFDNTRENGPESFAIVKNAFFSDVCFYRPFMSQRNDLIICILYVKKPCGLL